MADRVTCVVIGGGAAGQSAALNLVRSRHRVLMVDEGRPRNAATLRSHGFLTRDGVSPMELRKLALAELATYSEVEVLQRSRVERLERCGGSADGFRVEISTRGQGTREVEADAVLIATGLREELPRIDGLTSYYGMSVFSCLACDGYEHGDAEVVLIGERRGLAERALLLSRFSDRITVCTNASDALAPDEELVLGASGVAVDHRSILRLEGEKGTLERVRFVDGGTIVASGGFVLPRWNSALEFVERLGLELDDRGLLVTDRDGRTSVPSVYAAGDVTTQGPQQLIVAAGAGARAAAVLTHDRLGIVTSH
jgi:thioredoxin reductase